MTMHFDPLPRRLAPAAGEYFRATVRAIGHASTWTIEAIGRLCDAFVINLMRRQMRRALHSLSDRLLAESGIRRSEIDAFVAELIPHGSHQQRRSRHRRPIPLRSRSAGKGEKREQESSAP